MIDGFDWGRDDIHLPLTRPLTSVISAFVTRTWELLPEL